MKPFFYCLVVLVLMVGCSPKTIDLYCYQDAEKVSVEKNGLQLYFLTPGDTTSLVHKSSGSGGKILLPEKSMLDSCRGILYIYETDTLVVHAYPAFGNLPASVMNSMIPDYSKVFQEDKAWLFMDDRYPFDHESVETFVKEIGAENKSPNLRVICLVTDRKTAYLKKP